ncbi:hypothetical protein [Rubinisphaera sp.]|uniref:hypothetical protein n=1 Tax=Rubinisphaera sp. TaxID=2024857 RepID=UPI000C0E369F|nr:hypothetical protein [Rubinisphaera sp.]MBV09000.1 hypothetical protein [Rubinisphaera sp.]HCS53268.1 hypothetical protein [Planctomycetaceae bacterium]|tara:strand:- start:4406 stop:4846 length:441 start_codon:yes stop_codon:yes gene_type:complete
MKKRVINIELVSRSSKDNPVITKSVKEFVSGALRESPPDFDELNISIIHEHMGANPSNFQNFEPSESSQINERDDIVDRDERLEKKLQPEFNEFLDSLAEENTKSVVKQDIKKAESAVTDSITTARRAGIKVVIMEIFEWLTGAIG